MHRFAIRTVNLARLSFSSFKCCSFTAISASKFFNSELKSFIVNAFDDVDVVTSSEEFKSSVALVSGSSLLC